MWPQFSVTVQVTERCSQRPAIGPIGPMPTVMRGSMMRSMALNGSLYVTDARPFL
jgi:hypothetical protein